MSNNTIHGEPQRPESAEKKEGWMERMMAIASRARSTMSERPGRLA